MGGVSICEMTGAGKWVVISRTNGLISQEQTWSGNVAHVATSASHCQDHFPFPS